MSRRFSHCVRASILCCAVSALLICCLFPLTSGAATTQPSTQPTTAPTQPDALDQRLSNEINIAVADKTYQCSPVQGGAFAKYPFEDVRPDGLLIGFRIGFGKFVGNDIIQFLQPIYLTP